jgi:hypothetical protein
MLHPGQGQRREWARRTTAEFKHLSGGRPAVIVSSVSRRVLYFQPESDC